MKKLLLVGLVVLGAVSYGRDHDYRSKNEFSEVKQENIEMQEMTSRMSRDEYEMFVTENNQQKVANQEKYSEFHIELETQQRGSENR